MLQYRVPVAAGDAATKGYVDSQVSGAGYVATDGSTTLTANWDVGGFTITNIATPGVASDAATKGYVDSGLSGKENSLGFTPLDEAGDTMTGNLGMGGFTISNLGVPVAAVFLTSTAATALSVSLNTMLV